MDYLKFPCKTYATAMFKVCQMPALSRRAFKRQQALLGRRMTSRQGGNRVRLPPHVELATVYGDLNGDLPLDIDIKRF